ncbi:hypothetical protein PENSPDRAFT_758206 [Peniophora sp. CONT]|nr:hypothetical protein PENSPDRAFT_758206 [Peniophora sp. CONT]
MTKPDSRPLLARSVKWSNFVACIVLITLQTFHGVPHCTALTKAVNVVGSFTVAFGNLLLFVRVGILWRCDKHITAALTIVYLGGTVVAQSILKLAYVAMTRD